MLLCSDGVEFECKKVLLMYLRCYWSCTGFHQLFSDVQLFVIFAMWSDFDIIFVGMLVYSRAYCLTSWFKPLILLCQLYTLVNFFSHESGLSKILKYEAISSTLSGEYLKCTLWWGYGHKLELKENVLICATGENTILQTIYSNFCKF